MLERQDPSRLLYKLCAFSGKEIGLCYLTGNTEAISYLHSKKIRNEGDGAKLISANDSQNFTYRGRFATKEDALL